MHAGLVYSINGLKRERNAVLFGYNYMERALFHTVPDQKGDSLELAGGDMLPMAPSRTYRLSFLDLLTNAQQVQR